jgi:hypothetical protein
MPARPVEAVFFWRFTKDSVYKPTYGREVESDKYTKDFLQVNDGSDVARALEMYFGSVPNAADEVDFTWKFRGGSELQGKVKRTTDRLNLRWPTGRTPPPWSVTTSPDPSTGRVIQGDPTFTDESDANAQLAAIQARGDDPWLVAVKLAEERALHARSYLGHPPNTMLAAGTSQLPERVREAMSRLPNNTL